MPEPESSLAEALERWREWADGKACCDYALHVDIPRWNDRVRQELHTMVHEKGLLPVAPCPHQGGQGVTVLSSVLWLSCACWGPVWLPAGVVPTNGLVGRAAQSVGGISSGASPGSPLPTLCSALRSQLLHGVHGLQGFVPDVKHRGETTDHLAADARGQHPCWAQGG